MIVLSENILNAVHHYPWELSERDCNNFHRFDKISLCVLNKGAVSLKLNNECNISDTLFKSQWVNSSSRVNFAVLQMWTRQASKEKIMRFFGLCKMDQLFVGWLSGHQESIWFKIICI